MIVAVFAVCDKLCDFCCMTHCVASMAYAMTRLSRMAEYIVFNRIGTGPLCFLSIIFSKCWSVLMKTISLCLLPFFSDHYNDYWSGLQVLGHAIQEWVYETNIKDVHYKAVGEWQKICRAYVVAGGQQFERTS